MSDPAGPSIRLAVCVSGGGTTLQNLIDRIASSQLKAEVVQVIASRQRIGAITRAAAAGLSVVVIRRGARSVGEHSAAIFEQVRTARADLVVLGGFLPLLEIPEDFRGRVINVHPSLIPAFSGQGYHGLHVHRAAIEWGVKLSGCTIHFVDDTYDTGPIIFQLPVPVLATDTPASLAARVFDAESEALPEAITLYAAGKLEIVGRRVVIRP